MRDCEGTGIGGGTMAVIGDDFEGAGAAEVERLAVLGVVLAASRRLDDGVTVVVVVGEVLIEMGEAVGETVREESLDAAKMERGRKMAA